MELLTRNNYEGWMQKLMERLDRQDELLLAMKAEGKQPTITESIRLTAHPSAPPAKAENAPCFLQFDLHGDVLDNFFKNFFRQCKEPSRFRFLPHCGRPS